MRFGVDLGGLVNQHFSSQGDPVTLRKVTEGDYLPGGVSGRERIVQEFEKLRGYREEFDASRFDGKAIQDNDCMINIYARTLPAGMTISTKDEIVHGGTTFAVVRAPLDQAKAMFRVHARGPSA